MTNIKELIDRHNEIVDARLKIKDFIMKQEQFPALNDLDLLDEYITKNAINLCQE